MTMAQYTVLFKTLMLRFNVLLTMLNSLVAIAHDLK